MTTETIFDGSPEAIRALCDQLDKRRRPDDRANSGQTLLARKMRIDVSTVHRWLSGAVTPRPGAVYQMTNIARRNGMSVGPGN